MFQSLWGVSQKSPEGTCTDQIRDTWWHVRAFLILLLLLLLEQRYLLYLHRYLGCDYFLFYQQVLSLSKSYFFDLLCFAFPFQIIKLFFQFCLNWLENDYAREKRLQYLFLFSTSKQQIANWKLAHLNKNIFITR